MRLRELLILLESVDSVEEIVASVLKRPKMVAGLIANAKTAGFTSHEFSGGEDPENHPRIVTALVQQLHNNIFTNVTPKSYLRWLTYRAAEDQRAFHRQIGHLLAAFESARAAGTSSKKAINEYKTLEEFINEYMQPAVNTLNMHQDVELADANIRNNKHYILQAREKLITEGEAEILYSDEKVYLVLIKSFNASVAFGSREWCTAQQEGHWDTYNNGTFAIIVFKQNPFYKIYAVQADGKQFQDFEDNTLPRYERKKLLVMLPDEIENILVNLADTDADFITAPDATQMNNMQLAGIISSGHDDSQSGGYDEADGFDEELYDDAVSIFQEKIKQSPEDESKYIELIVDATLEWHQDISISDIIWRINSFTTSEESLSRIMIRLASQLNYQNLDDGGDTDSRSGIIDALLDSRVLTNDIESGEFDVSFYLYTEIVYLHEVHNKIGDELLIKLLNNNESAAEKAVKSMLSKENMEMAEYHEEFNEADDIGDIFDTLTLAIRVNPEIAEYTELLKKSLDNLNIPLEKRIKGGADFTTHPLMLRLYPDEMADRPGTTFELIAADKPEAVSALIDTNKLTHGKLNYAIKGTDGTTMLQLAKILKDNGIEIPGDIALKMVQTILNTATNPPPPKEGTYEEVPYLLKFANTRDLSF